MIGTVSFGSTFLTFPSRFNVRTDRLNIVEFKSRLLSSSNSISNSLESKSTHSQCSFLNHQIMLLNASETGQSDSNRLTVHRYKKIYRTMVPRTFIAVIFFEVSQLKAKSTSSLVLTIAIFIDLEVQDSKPVVSKVLFCKLNKGES